MNNIRLVFDDGNVVNTEKGINVFDVIKNYCDKSTLGIKVNGKLVSTDYDINEDAHIECLDVNSRIGQKMYIKGLQFVMLLAVNELYGDYTKLHFKHSLDKSIYAELYIDKMNSRVLTSIKKKMKEIIDEDIKFNRVSSPRSEISEYEKNMEEPEKVLNYRFMTSHVVSLYELKDLYNYFYYILPPTTGVLKEFNLTYVKPNGIVLSYPINGKIPKYEDTTQVLESFKNNSKNLEKLGINYSCDINKLIVDGNIRDYIQMIEGFYVNQIDNIVDYVSKNKSIKAIFMSGPSSSGKTTSSKRLSLALRSRGIDTLVMSTDDYYLDRVETPKDENGDYDFEAFSAIDYKLFDVQMGKLLRGEEIIMPKFDFISGEKEFKGKPISLKKNQILIVEGLHAVNDKMSTSIDKKNKLKIYISPFTPISLDRHNHISTTDLRFLRRLVRDYNTRGYSASETLEKWIRMRKSEESNVYPYQRKCDFILNTSLAYEIGVLRTYASPLLYCIDETSEYYGEALRIQNFLTSFINIPSEYVPNTSILREFIGDSYFE